MIRDRVQIRFDPRAVAASCPRVVVIGGGITGLAAAFRLSRHAPEVEITLLERENRLGGLIVTERVDGFVVEGGPEALFGAKPRGPALCHELGLGDRLIRPNEATRRAFILRRGRLRPLPEGLVGFGPTRLGPIARSPLLTGHGKLRMGLDLVLPARLGNDDETLEAFITRRLGREAYERLVQPLAESIYAADGGRLSLAAAFPHLRRAEVEQGGLIKSARAVKRARSCDAAAPATPPPFVAPRTGLAELVEALECHLRVAGVQIVTGMPVERICARPGATGYEVIPRFGAIVRADAVICATPAFATALLLSDLDPAIASALGRIPQASVATVTVAYPLAAIPRPLDGHGYLVPRTEGRPVFACTWTSAKWSNRAPRGYGVIRASLGGTGREEVLAGTPDDLTRAVREEVREVLGITAKPVLQRVFRWPRALPQYELGHLERVATIEARLGAHPGLLLAGNAYRGVGIADCVQSGETAADRALAVIHAHGR